MKKLTMSGIALSKPIMDRLQCSKMRTTGPRLNGVFKYQR